MSNELAEKIHNIDIVEVIKNYLQLFKKGNNYLAICPFHGDTKPSLTINSQKNIFKCFACSTGGDAIKFVMLYKNINYQQALIEIAQQLNLDEKLITKYKNSNSFENERIYSLNSNYLEFCQSFLNNKENNHVLNYLKNRGISDEIINAFKIGFNPNKTGHDLYDLLTNNDKKYVNIDDSSIFNQNELVQNNLAIITNSGNILDTFRNRIVFSICNDEGKIIGFSGRTIDSNDEPKYLNTSETSIFKKSDVLYNWNNAIKEKKSILFIVEGFMDAIALYRIGVSNCVATMGTAFSDNHLNKITNNKLFKTIVLGFDNDEAGKKAIISVGKKIGKKINVYVVKRYDSKYKDFDEVLNNSSSTELNKIINDQVHFSLFLLDDLFQNNSSSNSLSNKEEIFNLAIEIIQKYGNSLYESDYLTLLSQHINFDSTIIKNKINSALNNSKNNYLNKNHSTKINFSKNSILVDCSLAKNDYDKIIIACLSSRDATKIVFDNFPDQIQNKLFKIHYEFINKIKLILDFYKNNNSNLPIIEMKLEFMNYVKEKYYEILNDNCINDFILCFNKSESIINRFDYNYDNLVKLINNCYKNELISRNSILKNLISKDRINYNYEQIKAFIKAIDENNIKIKNLQNNKI